MTRRGDIISFEAAEAGVEFPALPKAIEEQGQSVQIRRTGRPVAILQTTTPEVDPLQVHPELKAIRISNDAFAPLENEDWPEDCR